MTQNPEISKVREAYVKGYDTSDNGPINNPYCKKTESREYKSFTDGWLDAKEDFHKEYNCNPPGF